MSAYVKHWQVFWGRFNLSVQSPWLKGSLFPSSAGLNPSFHAAHHRCLCGCLKHVCPAAGVLAWAEQWHLADARHAQVMVMLCLYSLAGGWNVRSTTEKPLLTLKLGTGIIAYIYQCIHYACEYTNNHCEHSCFPAEAELVKFVYAIFQKPVGFHGCSELSGKLTCRYDETCPAAA